MYGLLAPRAHNYGLSTQNGFGGINANLGADNGEVLHVLDMTSDEYPLLATRRPRVLLDEYEGRIIGTATVDGERAYVSRTGESGDGLYYFNLCYKGDTYSFFWITDPERVSFAAVGRYVIILPFYIYFDTDPAEDVPLIPAEYIFMSGSGGEQFDGEVSEDIIKCVYSGGTWYKVVDPETGEFEIFHHLSDGELINIAEPQEGKGYDSELYRHWAGLHRFESSDNGTGQLKRANVQFGTMRGTIYGEVTISDGEYAGEPAHGNVLTLDDRFPHSFRAGDSVKISGCTVEDNNKTAVIRAVDGLSLIFSDNTFIIPEGTSYTEADVTVERDIPEMGVIFSHNNRMWGADNRNIYCSVPGDPLIWASYDYTAADSWSGDTGNTDKAGITGGASYIYPRFFSENHIYTVYGDTPEEFSIMVTNAKGTAPGANESFAIVNGLLIYLSDVGFMAYSGSLPQKIDYALGNRKIKSAIGASDGLKYYTWCYDGLMEHLYVYDSNRRMWHEESAENIEGLWHGDNLAAAFGGEIWSLGSPWEIPEDAKREKGLCGFVRFADFDMDTVQKKQIKEILIRHDVGGELKVSVYIDGEIDPTFSKVIVGRGKRTTSICGVPRRCDHLRIELEGRAPWVVYSIALSLQEGTTK